MTKPYYWSEANNLTKSFAMSADLDYFHRVYNMEVGEKGLRDRNAEHRDKLRLALKQKEKERDELARNIEQSASSLEKAREDQIKRFKGISYTDADLQETIDDIVKDKQAFAERHGLTADEADRAEYYALLMASMSPEERDNYLKSIASDDPKIASAIADDLQENNQVFNREFERVEVQYSKAEADQPKVFAADIDI